MLVNGKLGEGYKEVYGLYTQLSYNGEMFPNESQNNSTFNYIEIPAFV